MAIDMLESRSIFLKRFIADPTKIGSCTPSSHYLTRKMVRRLDWTHAKTIVELGAGTGVFTSYIMQHKRPDCSFLAIEQDPVMRADLKHRFPDCLYGNQAEDLSYLLKAKGLHQADYIISGLPFTVLPKDTRQDIMAEIVKSLAPHGYFIAFQYSPCLYRFFHRYFSHVSLSFEVRNVPPAFIFTCQK